jgi:hypothetical protein
MVRGQRGNTRNLGVLPFEKAQPSDPVQKSIHGCEPLLRGLHLHSAEIVITTSRERGLL